MIRDNSIGFSFASAYRRSVPATTIFTCRDDLGTRRTGPQSADGDPRHQKSLWEQISHLRDPPSRDRRISSPFCVDLILIQSIGSATVFFQPLRLLPGRGLAPKP